jgi:hypothetical protein
VTFFGVCGDPLEKQILTHAPLTCFSYRPEIGSATPVIA